MSITQFLNDCGFSFLSEGYSQQILQQVNDLILLINKTKINVMEIGFHAGHSAEIFLHNNKELTLTSFDLGQYTYVLAAKQYIDNTYPNRHTLIIGDSRMSVPKFYNDNKEIKFDVIFIDGGHQYEVAKADLDNCFRLAHKDTIVIMDDTIFRKDWEAEWTIGPSKTWMEHVEENKIIELGRREYNIGRGMCWGKYS